MERFRDIRTNKVVNSDPRLHCGGSGLRGSGCFCGYDSDFFNRSVFMQLCDIPGYLPVTPSLHQRTNNPI